VKVIDLIIRNSK